MAGKLKLCVFGLSLGLLTSSFVFAEETPQMRTLERRDTMVATHHETADTLKNTNNNGINSDGQPGFSLPKGPVASKSVKKSLADKVQVILNEKALNNTSVGIQVVDLDTGDVVYSHDESKLLKPASNTKLVTTAAALHILGPDYQFESGIYLKGKVEKGVLNGDLQLHIDHDFTWSNRFYDADDVPLKGLINQLKAAGIRKINGNVIVSGHVVYGGVSTATLSTALHLRRAGNQFGALLKKSKINYKGLAIRQTAKPEGKKVATWLSPILSEAIVPLNRVSHNEYADMLMLAIGHKTSGKNTYEAGAKAIKEWLAQTGLSLKGFAQNDGSGLSHDNRMSADFFTKLVAYMLRSPVGREWAGSLAISGYDGTYGGRLATDDAKGRVYAKSGTLRDTISGSGFFINRNDGHTYAFSIIVNGMRNRKVTRQSIDRIVRVFLGNHLNVQMPSAPFVTSFAKDDRGEVTAKWNSVKNAAGYRIYKSSDGSSWSVAAETKDTSYHFGNETAHIRVTSVKSDGTESKPSLIFSYRPGKKMMTVVENARCRADEAMRPVGHIVAHERPLASFVPDDWGVQTVRTAADMSSDALLFHSVACNGAIAWNAEDYTKSYRDDIPVIVNVVDAHLSADAQGTCAPASGKVLGCFGEAVLAKDRRIGERKSNLRLRKAAGTGSTRPSQVKLWNGSSSLFKMGEFSVAAQAKSTKGGTLSLYGFDLQALDSLRTQKSVWNESKLSK